MDTKTRKCMCGGTAVLKFNDLKLFDGKLVLKDQPYYQCTRCGEEYVTSEQMGKQEPKVRAFLGLERKFISTGGSVGLTFPPLIAKQQGIKKGGKFRLVIESPKKVAIVLE
ncbi:MAG: YgiT-type zinc finger protein [Candidatus Micrarchaeota archaeon]